jgi:hypothetical protein
MVRSKTVSIMFVALLFSATLFLAITVNVGAAIEPLAKVDFSCKAEGECIVLPVLGPQASDSESFLGQGSISISGTVNSTATTVDAIPGVPGGPYLLYLPSEGVVSQGKLFATWNGQEINLTLTSSNAEGFFMDDPQVQEFQDTFTAGIWPGGDYSNCSTTASILYTGSIKNATGTFTVSGYACALTTAIGSGTTTVGIYVSIFNSDGSPFKVFIWMPTTAEFLGINPPLTLHASTVFEHKVEINEPESAILFSAQANGECAVLPSLGPLGTPLAYNISASYIGQGATTFNGSAMAKTCAPQENMPVTFFAAEEGVKLQGSMAVQWNNQTLNITFHSDNAKGQFENTGNYNNLFTAGLWNDEYFTPSASALTYEGTYKNATGTYPISGNAAASAMILNYPGSEASGKFIAVWLLNPDGTPLKAILWALADSNMPPEINVTMIHAAEQFQHSVKVYPTTTTNEISNAGTVTVDQTATTGVNVTISGATLANNTASG